MPRTLILVLDSLGIGATPDASSFGDVGADTLGHIADWCAGGGTGPDRPAPGMLHIPNLCELGLGRASELATNRQAPGLSHNGPSKGRFAACAEKSFGKDTPSGHWEMAGLPVAFDWGYFGQSDNSFPSELLDALCAEADLPGTLGNKAASGTDIINELGDAHKISGKPICYTSADSVLQIAAHEETFGVERLYRVCDIARKLVDDYNIGRVIARPFLGNDGDYKRTGNRRDIATPPPGPTLLDIAANAGREVISIGKIADIFAHRGLTKKIKATGNRALFDATLAETETAPDGAIIFTNFVDFDQEYGHRRNPAGYAVALERFDRSLPKLTAKLKRDDIVVITADHGCDPTWPGNDHTREYVPFLLFGPSITGGNMGVRDSFADIGQTIASYLDLPELAHGVAADIT